MPSSACCLISYENFEACLLVAVTTRSDFVA